MHLEHRYRAKGSRNVSATMPVSFTPWMLCQGSEGLTETELKFALVEWVKGVLPWMVEEYRMAQD